MIYRHPQSWDIDQQIKLYKSENAIDQQITFTPVRFTGALTNVTLNVKADCFGPCEAAGAQLARSDVSRRLAAQPQPSHCRHAALPLPVTREPLRSLQLQRSRTAATASPHVVSR
ncbi:hypothetical protein [Streptomyces sp. FL07-04A]|uniref:hypothetical protein n=1 Tax=Streptomyces sp. FL07-04A TaxID=3028658 RepID=UPI0029AEEE73|nr:hypothetical protein [Streptomyces sp. FL07-04A]MDX3579232.1 hypothetical protein [Streptomyces sp. FL07-04A]